MEFLKENEKFESVLQDDNNKYTIFPIDQRYVDIWKLYKKHESCIWKSEEIDYTADLNDWENKLNDNERMFIENILAFFAGSDGIVLENILENFSTEIQNSESRAFYALQGHIENVHNETYSLLIDTYVKDENKQKLFNALNEIECVKQKGNWAKKWMNQDYPFAIRLVGFAIVEGIFFSGAFCAIFWLKQRGLMTHSLGMSNELISRDEGLHVEFAVTLFHKLKNKPTQEIVHKIFKEAVEIEIMFINDSIKCDMIGMNTHSMTCYIQFVADRLLTQLGYQKIWEVSNPFDFMTNISMENKSNFHDRKVTEYKFVNFPKVNKKEDFEVLDTDTF